jgi:hypothetical protein
MPDIDVTERGYEITPPTGKALVLNGVQIKKITCTVGYAAFTDGGSTAGTYSLPDVIPVGALYVGTAITNVVGFAGDTSAVLTLGDGTDVDRYNTSTINVFATAANGIASGVPSGALYHAAQVTPKITITSASDWGAVNAGSVTIEMYYLT